MSPHPSAHTCARARKGRGRMRASSGGCGAAARGQRRRGVQHRAGGRCGTKGARHRVRHSRRSMPLACACMSCAATAACGWRCACVRSGTRQRHPWGLVSLEDGCAAGCAVQEGGRAVGKASSGSMQPRRRTAPCYVPCCRAARGFARRHDHRGCGQALGVPPHSTAQAAACSLWKESGAGVAGAGCDGAESAADAVSAAPPSGTCGGGAWPWWAAHPREAMEERVPRQLGKLPSVTSGFCTFYLTPRLTPRLALPPLSLSTQCGGARRCAPAPSGGGRGARLLENIRGSR